MDRSFEYLIPIARWMSGLLRLSPPPKQPNTQDLPANVYKLDSPVAVDSQTRTNLRAVIYNRQSSRQQTDQFVPQSWRVFGHP